MSIFDIQSIFFIEVVFSLRLSECLLLYMIGVASGKAIFQIKHGCTVKHILFKGIMANFLPEVPNRYEFSI